MAPYATRTITFLLIVQAMFVGSTFRSAIPIVMVTLAATLLASARGWRLRRRGPGKRHWIVSAFNGLVFLLALSAAIAACGIWRSMAEIPLQQGRVQAALDTCAHACLIISLFIWLARPLRGHYMMLPLGLLMITLCVFAGGASTSQAAQTTVALATCAGFCLASHCILGAPAVNPDPAAMLNQPATKPNLSLTPLLVLLTMSLLLMATSVVANSTQAVLPIIQQKLQEQLQVSINMSSEDQIIGGTRYVRGSTLGSVRKVMIKNPQEIALTVYSDPVPGYLRGNAFDTYRRQQWKTVQTDFILSTSNPEMLDRDIAPSKTAARKSKADNQSLTLSTFLLNDPNGPTVELEIHNDPMKGTVVFLPQTTSWVEAKSNELTVNPHGIVRLGVDMSEPYVAVVSSQSLQEAMSAERKSFLLDLPPTMDEFLLDYSVQRWGNLQTFDDKTEAVSTHFRENFEYSLELPERHRGYDPIVNFLDTRHPAHCEYFATATVLLLRSLDVPARYITGYVVDEYNSDTESWVARNLDAHAWVEAYDETSQRWVAVESTPGRQYITITSDDQSNDGDGLFDVFYSGGDDYGDTFLGRAIGWLLSIRVTDPLNLLFRAAQLPLFCVAVFLIWTKFLRPARAEDRDIDRASRRMLKQADRKCRKHELVRRRSETLNQFADRIEAFCVSEKKHLRESENQRLQTLPNWYRQFASARYQGIRPAPLA
ncbi:MAG: transglutaminase-like domain-containing protein [Rubripirellula sp.]